MVHTRHSDDIAADVPVDLRIDGDRQVGLGDTGDLDLTVGLDNLAQSVTVALGDQLRSLVGEPITPTKINVVESNVLSVLQNDVQISNVRSVEVSEINTSTDTVTLDCVVDYNNSFELPVEI